MQKSEYLDLAIKNGLYNKRQWAISIACITQEDEKAYLADPYDYRLVRLLTGYYFVDPKNKNGESTDWLTRIDNVSVDKPLCYFLEPYVVKPTIFENTTEELRVSLGTAINNKLLLCDPFGNKIPFIKGEINAGKVEDIIASRMLSNPDDDNYNPNEIYVRDYLKFRDNCMYLEGLSLITNAVASYKTMVEAPGIVDFKAKLLKEKYNGKITDPVKLVEFEKDLGDYDEKWLAGDRVADTFIQGGKMKMSRKKLFQVYGADKGFREDTTVNPVIASLNEGISPEHFDQYNNASRYGSAARGAETALGGELVKWLFRLMSGVTVSKGDCGTVLGLRMTVDEDTVDLLVGMYVIGTGGKPVGVKDKAAAKTLIGKTISVRVPGYCKNQGTDYCSVCCGDKTAANPTGISVSVANLGSTVMLASMAAMHSKARAVVGYELTDLH